MAHTDNDNDQDNSFESLSLSSVFNIVVHEIAKHLIVGLLIN